MCDNTKIRITTFWGISALVQMQNHRHHAIHVRFTALNNISHVTYVLNIFCHLPNSLKLINYCLMVGEKVRLKYISIKSYKERLQMF